MNTSTNQVMLLAKHLIKSSIKLVTAESCTGGGLAEILTSVAGSSAWYERGFITYSNDAKAELLNVNRKTIELYGAVSEEVAEEMVIGAVNNSHAQVGVSITGIAGPDGGTKEKPVGTVCLGWYLGKDNIKTTRIVFDGNRQSIREQSCLFVLQGLVDELGIVV